jgi:protein involved in polysaccharide export with SLBB domain
MPPCGFFLARAAAVLALVLAVGTVSTAYAQTPAAPAAAPENSGGPVRIRQPQALPTPAATADVSESSARYKAGEFELYIQSVASDPSLRRFGSELVIDNPGGRAAASDAGPNVPPDYRVAPGDELLVTMWGSVDADLRVTVDRAGRVSIPRVGTVSVNGLLVPEATKAIERQAARIFKNFETSVALGQLRNIRIFVTGFAVRPGAYTVSSLATLATVVFGRSGGPSASGSFRNIELRRGGKTVARLDLYDLMMFGRRDADQVLQADDVVHIGPIGRQVALIGSVNKPAIFELKGNETIADALVMGGGFTSVADRSRVAVERVSERNERRVRQLALPADGVAPLDAGDVIRVFSAVDAVLPLDRQNKRVRIEGEVQRPGTYIMPPESTIADALRIAGNLTPGAFVFGTEFNRESVRATQQVNFDRALRDLELELNRRAASTRISGTEEAIAQAQQRTSSEQLLARLRDAKPTGRIVLQLQPDARELPSMALEDGDRLYVPPVPTTVGVFGSVFNAGSYLYGAQRKVDDYLRLAGSPTRGADKESIFIVRANGSVISAQQDPSNWLGFGGKRVGDLATLPGDTVFVPEEANKTTFVQAAKDWTQVLYQFGLGLAGIKVLLP